MGRVTCRHLKLLTTLLLALAGCYLVTDAEVLRRVQVALPFTQITEIKQISKSISCISAVFVVGEKMRKDQVFALSETLGSVGLGRNWVQSSSFADLFETPLKNSGKLTSIDATLTFAKSCLKEIKVPLGKFHNQAIWLSHSKSGKELLIVFEANTNEVLYLAQGR